MGPSKGKTENALLRMPFKSAYMFRPGYIQPLHGIRAKTGWYNAVYAMMAPLYPLWKALFPNAVITTEQLGRAMIRVAKQGGPKHVLESSDINSISAVLHPPATADIESIETNLGAGRDHDRCCGRDSSNSPIRELSVCEQKLRYSLVSFNLSFY